jgi:hypothetical protein
MGVANNLDEEPPDVASASRLPISDKLGSILRRALWKRREGWYASVGEMKADLGAYMDDRLHNQVPVTWTPGRQTVCLNPQLSEGYKDTSSSENTLRPVETCCLKQGGPKTYLDSLNLSSVYLIHNMINAIVVIAGLYIGLM